MSPAAWGAVAQPAVVSENPANFTPSLVDTGAGYKPIVDAIAQSGNTMFAGGRFARLTQGGADLQPDQPGHLQRHTGEMSDLSR